VIAHGQLLQIGMSRSAIKRRIERGWLIVLHRGVYALGHDVLSQRARWMAAVLAGGPGAVLSHRSAAALWDLTASHGLPDVTVPSARRTRRGVSFHRCLLPDDERTTRDGIPVTTVARTLLDLASAAPPHQFARALNEAEVRNLGDQRSLDDLLHRYPRRPGTPIIRAALVSLRTGTTVIRSDLEALFLAFVDDVGLPRPMTNVIIEGLEVDCLWRRERVAVELDSRTFHDTAIAYERDRERDRILNAADWRPVRITWRQLTRTPAAVDRDLRRMLTGTAFLATGGTSRHTSVHGTPHEALRRDRGRGLPPSTYSNDGVIQRIEREEGVDRETARAWFGEALVFLDLCAQSDDVISPPKEVDAAWHAFLLHSRDYDAYCRERFGRVIHHQPGDMPDPEAYRRGYLQRARYGPEAGTAALWLIPVGMEADGLTTEEMQEQIRAEELAGAYGGDGGSDGGGGDGGGGDGGGTSCGGGCSGGGS